MDSKTLWVLKSFDDKRSFKGNEGYANEPESSYLYDDTVINHGRVKVGDLAVIINKTHITGIATIDKIEIQPSIAKKQYSCPICGTKRHGSRKKMVPKFRCKNKHEFDEPVVSTLVVNQYKAIYSDYKPVKEKISTSLLKAYYINYNAYYSIQSANVTLMEAHFSKFDLSEKINLSEPHTSYIPSITDSRDYRILETSIRPEQWKKRSKVTTYSGAN